MPQIDIPLEDRLIGVFLRKQAKLNGGKPYLTIEGRSVNFGEMDAMTRAAARGLAGLGIGDGGRVMIMSPNCLEFVIAWFAANLRGAAAVPVNPTLKGLLLEAVLKDCRPDAILIHTDLIGELTAIDATLMPRHVLVVGDGPRPAKLGAVQPTDFDALYINEGPDPEIPGDYRRLQTISYTSGTTGPSKGAMIPNSAAFCAPLNYIKVMGMEPQDSIYAPLPLFHGMSSRHGVMPALVLGSHITIDARFSASRYWERAAECQATIGTMVHAMVPLLAVQPPRDSDRAHLVRRVFNTKHDKEFEERFGVRMVEAYALTETSHILHTPFPERRWGSTGCVNPDWEVRLVDANDRPVPKGQPGELICRPKLPHIMTTGYLNKPEITLETFRDLWYHTGDILSEDEDGYFYYLDRTKDRIRRRGENISSADVEMGIVGHPDVVECVVVPYAAPDGEDHIRALVVLKAESRLQPAELHEWLRPRTPKFMLPRYIEVVEAIARTGTGKFEKRKYIQEGLGAGAWDADRTPEQRNSPI